MAWLLKNYRQLPLWLQAVLWMGVPYSIGAGIEVLFSLSPLPIVTYPTLGLAFFLLLERPLARYQLSDSIENGLAVLMILFFVFQVATVYMLPWIQSEELADQPCAEKNIPAKCYNLSFANCQAVWASFHKTCTEKIRAEMGPTRVTALIGPAVKQCTYKKYDQSFRSARQMTDNSTCLIHFQKMDSLNE